ATPEMSGLEGAVRAEIEQRILVNSTLAAANGPRVVALAGPPGAGKTTMLAKLAVTWGLAERRPLALVSMDDFRVAGADQLRSYATILGAGFQALDSVGALAQVLDEHQGKRLVLIDTPGYGPRDMDRAAGLARLLSPRPGREPKRAGEGESVPLPTPQGREEHEGRGLVLTDPPGYAPRDMDRGADLARFLSTRPG